MVSRLMILCISPLLLSLVPTFLNPHSVDARCPNGYHRSPSGDCEKVTHSDGLPRCPDGCHRSPDGDCERVSLGNSGGDETTESNDDENNDDNSGRGTQERNDEFD